MDNTEVTEELKKNGAKFIDNPNNAKRKLIIRAHGVPKEIYNEAKKINIEIKDLTCPKVLHIHNIAEEYNKKNYFIFLVGQQEHPETIGTISFCGEHSYIIENINDVATAIKKFKESKLKNLLVIAQTTFSMEKFNNITAEIKKNIQFVDIKNTICDATKKRQEETLKISKQVDMMIIIGGKHSSNSNKLYEIAKKNCKNVIFIENKNELNLDIKENIRKIGIMAGASTPQKSIIEVVDIIKKIC